MTPYLEALRDAMSALAELPNTIFMGQSVLAGGTALRRTTEHLPQHKLLELPVMEDAQLGMATGIALGGYLPICCYPRWPFLVLAANQLVNHLDKIPLYGNGYDPKVIVRVLIPTPTPLDPGPQHLGDYTTAFSNMCKTVHFVELYHTTKIAETYYRAAYEPGSWVIVEHAGMY